VSTDEPAGVQGNDVVTATALITGINGQDGSHMADLLLAHGYQVIGLVRPGGLERCERIAHLRDAITVVEADLLDTQVLRDVVTRYRPAQIYNFAARASSSQFFEDPVATGECNGIAVARLLDAICSVDTSIRFCQASSSEMFGNAPESPQSEATPFRPRNPYGIAKLYAHWMTVNYRQVRGLFACSSILFNHEGPRRGTEYVTRKISRAVAHILRGRQRTLELGDLEARRDWGFAGDYVRAMWLMLQHSVPDDYVLATGQTHSVREFCEIAFGHVALRYQDYVVTQPQPERPREVVQLVGDPAKAREVLGWRPTVSFEQLVCSMVDADLRALEGQ
jgi:GDPmannose 4,6-dehydratase